MDKDGRKPQVLSIVTPGTLLACHTWHTTRLSHLAHYSLVTPDTLLTCHTGPPHPAPQLWPGTQSPT